MTIKARTGIKRRGERQVPLLDEPPVGFMQAIVLKLLDEMGPEQAYGYNVLEHITLETGVWIDPGLVYGSIRKLLDKELIEENGTRPQPNGPPLKLYKVSAAGRAALKSAFAHYQALADFLNDKRKATRS